MKIEHVHSYVIENPWNPWFFVELVTDTGVTGIGEGIGYHWCLANQAYLEQNKSRLCVGRDPHDIERMVADARRMLGIDWGLGMVERGVLSAVEMACWDILGKTYGIPVYKLLGGACRQRIRVYANGWYNDIDTNDPDQWAAKAQEVVSKGYTAIKFDPYRTAYRDISPADFRHSVEVVRRIREAVGLDIGLIVEAHARFLPEAAVRIACAIEEYDILWLEAPVLGSLGPEVLKEVTSKVNVAIGTDVIGITDFAAAIRCLGNRAAGIFQPDVGYSCGMLEVKKMGALAEAMGVLFAPHHSLGPVCTAATVHVSFATPSFYIMECFEDYAYPDWADDLVTYPTKVIDGHIELPERPGLGVEFNNPVAKAHPLRGDQILNLLTDNWERRSGVVRS